MNLAEDILNFRDIFSSAKTLVDLHGPAAWYVADKRSLDCYEFGYDLEAAAWYHIKIVIAEMDAKANLAETEIH